jgi:hypothetical protein
MACSERWVSHYSGPETSIEDICGQLVKYEGGKVDLHQDDSSGIATIRNSIFYQNPYLLVL